jgi:hypothetical protein
MRPAYVEYAKLLKSQVERFQAGHDSGLSSNAVLAIGWSESDDTWFVYLQKPLTANPPIPSWMGHKIEYKVMGDVEVVL